MEKKSYLTIILIESIDSDTHFCVGMDTVNLEIFIVKNVIVVDGSYEN